MLEFGEDGGVLREGEEDVAEEGGGGVAAGEEDVEEFGANLLGVGGRGDEFVEEDVAVLFAIAISIRLQSFLLLLGRDCLRYNGVDECVEFLDVPFLLGIREK